MAAPLRQGQPPALYRPGKPVQNVVVESLYERLRDECLDRHWFLGLAHARAAVEVRRRDYNRAHAHSAPGYRPPKEFRAASHEAAIRPAGAGRTLELRGPNNGGRS